MTTTRHRLSRVAVVAAACELLDEDGVKALTIRALGERLGVTGMALYRHVESRADLEEAVVAYVLTEVFTDDDRALPWDEGVACWMQAVRHRMKAHPWVTSFVVHGHALSVSWLDTLYELQLVLKQAGLSSENVARELQRISRATVGITRQEIGSPLAGTRAAVQAALDGMRDEQSNYWRAAAKEFERYSDDALFSDVVADTIARLRREGARRRRLRGRR